MSTNGETPTENPRYVISGGDVRNLRPLLLPDKLSCCPGPVKHANEVAVDAVAKARTAGANLRAARDEAERAPAIDAAADKSAVALGLPLPERGAGAAAREAMRDCARRSAAQDGAARDAVTMLLRQIHKHRVTWMDEQRSTIEAIEDEAREQHERLTRTLADLARERQVQAMLELFPEQGSVFQVRFDVPISTPPELTALKELIDATQREPARPQGPVSKMTLGSSRATPGEATWPTD
jgi:hypothetical protein